MSTQSRPRVLQDRVDEMSQAVRICLLLGLLILFNIYPDKVGIYRNLLEPSTFFAPVLGAGFYAALPWLNTWWLAALTLATTLLFAGRWTRELRLADWAVDVLGIAVLCRLIAAEALLVPIPEWPMPTWTLNMLTRLVLGLALFGQVVGVLRDLARLLPAWVPDLSREGRS